MYISRLVTSPDFQQDINQLRLDAARGDVEGAICDALGAALLNVPAVWIKGGEKAAKKFVLDILKGSSKAIKAPTNRNGLRNVMLKNGSKPFADAQAHHGLPWKYKDWFAEKGIDVNNSKYGAWVKGGGKGGHQSWSKAYDEAWNRFILRNPNATVEQIEAFYNSLRTNSKWGGGF